MSVFKIRKLFKYVVAAAVVAVIVFFVGQNKTVSEYKATDQQVLAQIPQTSEKVSVPAVVIDKTAPVVQIDDVQIPVEIESTTEQIKKGLSGRESLNAKSGMIFLFNKPYRYQFWMPNMNFPIDIIWIEDGKVADITPNISNEFDPKNPSLYKPKIPVTYVLEVNDGFAKANNITIGGTVIFHNIK